jgi:hypothetical protein
MSAFSSDQRLFATASGDAEGNSQLLVLNTYVNIPNNPNYPVSC